MGQRFSRQWGREPDGALYPAPFSFTMTGKLLCTDFKEIEGIRGDEGKDKGKVLVICTGENRLKMANGSVFATGHMPTELFVPLYHLHKAGFDIQISTPGAKPVPIEQWAMVATEWGGYDRQVNSIKSTLQDQLDRPADVKNIPTSLEGYAGVFIPGGHGPMINLHESTDVGNILLSAHEQGLPTAALCHGPNAFRATAKVTGDGKWPYAGYKMCCFTDLSDELMWWMHYLPGPMAPGKKVESELRKLGADIRSVHIDKMIVEDREVITSTCHRGSQQLAERFLEALKRAPARANRAVPAGARTVRAMAGGPETVRAAQAGLQSRGMNRGMRFAS